MRSSTAFRPPCSSLRKGRIVRACVRGGKPQVFPLLGPSLPIFHHGTVALRLGETGCSGLQSIHTFTSGEFAWVVPARFCGCLGAWGDITMNEYLHCEMDRELLLKGTDK